MLVFLTCPVTISNPWRIAKKSIFYLSVFVLIIAFFLACSTKEANANTAPVRQKITLPTKPAEAQEPDLSLLKSIGLSKAMQKVRLSSSVAYVIDQNTQEVLLNKNEDAVLPIASITKIMTAIVLREMKLPMDEKIKITRADIRSLLGNRSRLRAGNTLTRENLLRLMLMSSENVAAHALARSTPGGFENFIRAMRAKTIVLGMTDTHYADSSGLSSENRSSARDLALLLAYAYADPMLREFSTTPHYTLRVGKRRLKYNNSNSLVKRSSWDIGLQKTGFIRAAGRCLIMQAEIAGRQLFMVFLNAKGKVARLRDAERVKAWVQKVQKRIILNTFSAAPEAQKKANHS